MIGARMQPLHFVVPGHPVPKGRHRCACIGNRPRTFTPKATLHYEARVKTAAQAAVATARWTPLRGPVRLTVHVWFQTRTHGDLSNVVKAVEDAMNGVAYVDDKQIRRFREVEYGYDESHPRVEVWVRADERLAVEYVDQETGELRFVPATERAQELLEAVRAALYFDDREMAHHGEDALHAFALDQIAAGDFGEASELARVALSASDLDFHRYHS